MSANDLLSNHGCDHDRGRGCDHDRGRGRDHDRGRGRDHDRGRGRDHDGAQFHFSHGCASDACLFSHSRLREAAPSSCGASGCSETHLQPIHGCAHVRERKVVLPVIFLRLN